MYRQLESQNRVALQEETDIKNTFYAMQSMLIVFHVGRRKLRKTYIRPWPNNAVGRYFV